MTDVLRIKRRALGGAAGAPASLAVGELAFNEVDGGLYIGRSNGSVAQVNPTGGGTSTGIVGGRLTYVSATALKFAPFDGNQIKVNGAFYAIPNAGITGLANTSVFVNGTAGQNLAANTTYLVFAFNNSGTVTADFRTAATHATSTTAGNEGVEILTGDDTRSLIGMCRTNASSQFVNTKARRFVRTWFNSTGVDTANVFTADRSLTTGPTFAEIHSEIRNEFLLWSGERAQAQFASVMMNNSSSNQQRMVIGFDGVTPEPNVLLWLPTSAGFYIPGTTIAYRDNLTEGYHYATGLGAMDAPGVATGTWGGANVNYGVGQLNVQVR